MDTEQGGGRENIDWRQVRRPWMEPKLCGETSEWVSSLAESIRPIELCRRYPRIANDLCALWDLPHIWGVTSKIYCRSTREGSRGKVSQGTSHMSFPASLDTVHYNLVDLTDHRPVIASAICPAASC